MIVCKDCSSPNIEVTITINPNDDRWFSLDHSLDELICWCGNCGEEVEVEVINEYK